MDVITIRPHPLMLRRYLTKYSTLFLIPALQGILGFYSSGALSRAARTALFISLIWVTLSVLRYRRFRIRLFSHHAEITWGLFLRRHACIPYERVSCIFIKRSVMGLLFRAAQIRFETEAGSRRRADYQFVLRQRDTRLLIQRVYGGQQTSCVVRFPLRRVLLFCAMTSSAAAGLLTAAPLVNQAGKLLGEGFSRQLYGTINQAALLFGWLLPAAGGYLAAALLLGYLAAFFFLFSRYGGFRLRLTDDTVYASGGLGGGFTAVFQKSRIHAVVGEQGSLLRLIRSASVRVCVAGYGKSRGESALLIPCVQVRKLPAAVRALLPDFSFSDPQLRPSPKSGYRFLLPTLQLLSVTMLLTIFFALRTDYFAGIYLFAGLLLTVFLSLRLWARYLCWKRGGVTLRGRIFAVFCRGLKILRMEMPPEYQGFLRVRQGPADRRYGTCTLHTAVRSERATGIYVPCLNAEEVRREILRQHGEDIFLGIS